MSDQLRSDKSLLKSKLQKFQYPYGASDDKDEAGSSDVLDPVLADEPAGACTSPSKSAADIAYPQRAQGAGKTTASPAESEFEEATGGEDYVRAKHRTKKRSAEGPTPPKPKKAKKPKKAFGKTFQQATEKSLLGVVVFAENPIRMLSANQIATVRSELLNRLGEAIVSRSSPIPRFRESGVIKGRFHLACDDDNSFVWLQQSVAELTIKVGDSEPCALRLVKPSELPKLRRAEVFIPGPVANVDEVKTWL